MAYIPSLFLLLLLIIIGVITVRAFKAPDAKVEKWKNIAQVVGVAFAAFVVILKFCDGWGSTNMSVVVDTRRVPYNEKVDIVAVDIGLERGDYGGIQLYGGDVRAIDIDTGAPITPPVPIRGTERLAYSGEKTTDWDKLSTYWKYRITPNEKLHFGAAIRVPKGKAYIVQAVIHGYPDLWLPGRGYSQWRSSAVSLPSPEQVGSAVPTRAQQGVPANVPAAASRRQRRG